MINMNVTRLLHSIIQFVFFFHPTWCYNCWDGPAYSTKSPYKYIQREARIKPQPPSATCTPIQINMLHRHGNRYPSEKDVRKMVAMGAKLNKAVGKISAESKLKLPWECPFTEEQNKLLSSVGERELYTIGKNIQHNFPELFEQPYFPLLYRFTSTCKLRCLHSSSALGAGLFEHLGTIGEYKFQPIAIESNPCANDSVLRFFEDCEKYVKEVEESEVSEAEMNKFEKGPEMKAVLEKINSRLGTNDTGLTTKDLKSIFIACAYDLGMFEGQSGMCSLFDKEDQAVVEYLLELKHFYKRSAGFKITYASSCPLLRDILQTLTAAVQNTSRSYVGIFRSAHAETVIPLHALLGINLDKEAPTAENYQNMHGRRFRAGCMSPFSGNLYFILYRCGGDEFKIQLYVNEQIVKIPCCQSEVDCSFNDFVKCYADIVDMCNFDEMCQLSKSKHDEL